MDDIISVVDNIDLPIAGILKNPRSTEAAIYQELDDYDAAGQKLKTTPKGGAWTGCRINNRWWDMRTSKQYFARRMAQMGNNATVG